MLAIYRGGFATSLRYLYRWRSELEAGKSGGGRSYGYTVDRQPLADGTFSTGELIICPEELAAIMELTTPRNAKHPPC